MTPPVMAYIHLPQKERNNTTQQPKPLNEQQKSHEVRRDTGRFPRARSASTQPAPVTRYQRAQGVDSRVVRSQNHTSLPEKLVKISVWVKPRVKAELQRRADQGGEELVSLSATTNALIEWALQADIDMQYGAMLTPVIENTLNKHNSRTRYRDTLHVESLYFTAQTFYLATNLLSIQGIPPEIRDDIILEAENRAKDLLSKSSPIIADLLFALKRRTYNTEETGERGK